MDQLIDNASMSSRAQVPSVPIRGREAEQKLLTQWVRRHVHRNRGGVLWMEGPAGVGTSRMLTCAAEEALLSGARVLSASEESGRTATGLSPLLAALADDSGDLRHALCLDPPRRHVACRLLDRIESRLRALVLERPVVLLLDDVHEYDKTTLLAVCALMARLADPPLLWLLASQSHPDVPEVEALRRHLLTRRASHLELPPLAPDATRQMIRDLLGVRAAAAAPYCAYLDGLPATVQHLCALVNSGAAGPSQERAEFRAIMALLVARRLDRLSEPARELVTIASALGGTPSLRHLSLILGRPEWTLLRPLREALSARLLQAEADDLSFVHEPVRDAVEATLPRPLRASIRRRQAEIRAGAAVSALTPAHGRTDAAGPRPPQAPREVRAAAREPDHVASSHTARQPGTQASERATGDILSADRLTGADTDEMEPFGRRALPPAWGLTRARLLLDAGQLDAAEGELAAAGAATDLNSPGEPSLMYVRAHLACHRGDTAAIDACRARARATLSGGDPCHRWAAAWIELIIAAHRGRKVPKSLMESAAEHFRQPRASATAVAPEDTVLFVRTAVRSGLRELAAAAVEFSESRALRHPHCTLFGATAEHARGLLESTQENLCRAADQYGHTRLLLRAHAWEDIGTLVAAANPGEAETHYERALEVYDSCGAFADRRRVARRLRNARLTARAAASPAQAPAASGRWRGLTPAELAVVRLVAQGATNREAAARLFLSPHTVNSHLRHAFEKLGVRSRVHMVRLYLRELDRLSEPVL
ncbi:helix-turn-helix transcriptional regulator [Actinacidiphila guanduensis]|nr:LuxR family transcriptional regulator [Actinacidiphila guanduensis]